MCGYCGDLCKRFHVMIYPRCFGLVQSGNIRVLPSPCHAVGANRMLETDRMDDK